MRLLTRYASGNRLAKVYRNTEWDEYVTRFYVDGEYQVEADHHTDDLEDASRTALSWVSQWEPNHE